MSSKYSPKFIAEDLAYQRPERWEGAELLAESLEYRRQRRPYRTNPPELDHFEDTGCPISPKCLACPRFRCIEEESKQVRKAILAEYKKGPR
jgi:hypothetical protein